MAGFNNPAMQGYGGQNPLLGAPSPFAGYNPLNSGNQYLDMMFAQYAPQFLNAFGMTDFLPQQFPAQNIMDQMISAKYMRASAAAEQNARNQGTEILAQRMNYFRSHFDHSRLSPMGAEQFKALAGTVNNRTVMPLLEGLMGSQNVEDVFFGRRGDPAQLQRAVNEIGFYRPDSVSGGRRMSEDTLSQFSTQIYNNLYGPDADLNDVSGLSAGRVGSVMSDLARRGLLPQSMSQLTANNRRREIGALGFDSASQRFADAALDRSIFGDESRDAEGREITDPAARAKRAEEIKKVREAVANNAPLEELEDLAGGADTVRKIDASRVANSLKGYSEAVGAVRQIFGDNGMGNAPMGQLIAALEALTQNSMSSMSAGKIENLMRRTQMASREGGVSLEALMGLSARTGALAQQRGLAPEIAAFTNVGAMEYAAQMRDSGQFRAAFGRMDPDKAMLFLAEAGLNATDSNVGRQLGALERMVQSDPDRFKDTDAAKMMNAIKRGDTSFVNAAGATINIADELGRDPTALFGAILDQGGMSRSLFNSLVKDSATQEFSVGLEDTLKYARQGAENKNFIANQLLGRGKMGRLASVEAAIKDGKISGDAVARIQRTFATNFGADIIDLVDNTQTQEERIDTIYQTLRRSIEESGVAAADVDNTINTIFGNEAAARDYILQQMSDTNTALDQNGRPGLATQQQFFAARVVSAATGRSRMNNMRAGSALLGADGSNFLQRFSDALAGGPDFSRPGSLFGAVLNTMDSRAMEEELMAGVMEGVAQDMEGATPEERRKEARRRADAAFDYGGKEYAAATVNTKKEREDLIKSATKDKAGFDSFVEQVSNTVGAERNSFVGTSLVDDATLRARFARADNQDKALLLYRQLGLGDGKGKSPDAIADELVANANMKNLGLFRDKRFGLLSGEEVTAGVVSEFVNEESTVLYRAGLDPAARAKNEAFSKLGRQLDEGNITGATIAKAFGLEGADEEKTAKVVDAYLKGGSSDVFRKELEGLGLKADTKEHIDTMARLGFQANANDGLKTMGAAGGAARRLAAARATALEKAISDGDIRADSPIATALQRQKDIAAAEDDTTKKALEDAMTPEERKALETLETDDAAEFDRMVHDAASVEGKTKEGKDRTKSGAVANVNKMASAGMDMMGEAGGMIGQLATAISSAMSGVLSDLKIEPKIENVTVSDFKLPEGFAAELGVGMMSGLVGQIKEIFTGGRTPAAPERASAPAPMELTGSVELKGLDVLVAKLVGTMQTDMAPGGIPVMGEVGRNVQNVG